MGTERGAHGGTVSPNCVKNTNKGENKGYCQVNQSELKVCTLTQKIPAMSTSQTHSKYSSLTVQ